MFENALPAFLSDLQRSFLWRPQDCRENMAWALPPWAIVSPIPTPGSPDSYITLPAGLTIDTANLITQVLAVRLLVALQAPMDAHPVIALKFIRPAGYFNWGKTRRLLEPATPLCQPSLYLCMTHSTAHVTSWNQSVNWHLQLSHTAPELLYSWAINGKLSLCKLSIKSEEMNLQNNMRLY